MIRLAPLLITIAFLTGCMTGRDRSVAVEQDYGWLCQRTPPEGGGKVWVNKTLTVDGKHQQYSVWWRSQSTGEPGTGGGELFWTVTDVADWHRHLDQGRFDYTIERQPEGPIVATLILDGTVVQREQLLDRRAARSLRRSPRWGGTMLLDTSAAGAARIRAAHVAEFVVSGASGSRIALVRLPLPDWRLTDRLVADAFKRVDADAADYEHRCQRESGPEI